MIGADDPDVECHTTWKECAESIFTAVTPPAHGTNTVSPEAAIPEKAPPDVTHTGALAESPPPGLELPGRPDCFEQIAAAALADREQEAVRQ